MPWLDDSEDHLDSDEPRELACKRCGSTAVRWRQQGGKWVLFSLEPGKIHTCPLSTDDFNVVPDE